MSQVLYVYGTLRSTDQSPTHMIPGRMYDIGQFPGVKLWHPDAGSFVYAERMTVSDARLKELDDYEGYDPDNPEGSLFIRTPYRDGFVYTWNGSLDYPAVEAGDWLEHLAVRGTPGLGHNSKHFGLEHAPETECPVSDPCTPIVEAVLPCDFPDCEPAFLIEERA